MLTQYKEVSDITSKPLISSHSVDGNYIKMFKNVYVAPLKLTIDDVMIIIR